MPGQETCSPPVIVTLPAQINAATAEQAAGQVSAAFAPGVTVVIADLTATACHDCSAIRHLRTSVIAAHRPVRLINGRYPQCRDHVHAGASDTGQAGWVA